MSGDITRIFPAAGRGRDHSSGGVLRIARRRMSVKGHRLGRVQQLQVDFLL